MKLNSLTTWALAFICLGLLTWTAITAAHSSRQKTIMITKSTAILHVKNVEPSLKFWTERFGFKISIQVPEGDHIGFAALENQNVELMYQTYEGMKGDANNPLAKAAEQGPSFIFMEVSDIDRVVDALKGAEVVQGVHDTPYGAKEVIAKEPGDHFVIFSQFAKAIKRERLIEEENGCYKKSSVV